MAVDTVEINKGMSNEFDGNRFGRVDRDMKVVRLHVGALQADMRAVREDVETGLSLRRRPA